MLNMLYFLPMTFIGIYFWKKNLKNKRTGLVRVRSQTWAQRFNWLVIALLASGIYGIALLWMKGTLPFIDSTTTVFSIVATIMLNKRLTEQWFYWIAVDVLAIIMWVYIFVTVGSDVSMLVMWSAFLVNAMYGLYNWRRMEEE